MTIAIIGAGAAGLTAAYALRGSDTITLYEKSRGLSGRAATRWHVLADGQRVYIDHGAQYIRDESPALHQLLLEDLSKDELHDIGRPVWTFDQMNAIHEGDSVQNSAPKWSYAHGLATFGRLIAQQLTAAGRIMIKTETRVGKLAYASGQYRLFDAEGQRIGEADQVLVTIPSGQAADLLAASDLPPAESVQLEESLRTAVYRRCITIALGFDQPLKAREYYALINTDRRHPLSWLAFEHDKPGHVPPGHGVIIAQMSGAYSLDQWDAAIPYVTADVARTASDLLGEDLMRPTWTDYQRWRYSLPDKTVLESSLNGVLNGLWFAGDYTQGGRVHLAVQSGFDVARQMK